MVLFNSNNVAMFYCVYNNCSKLTLSGLIRNLASFSAPTEIFGCPSMLVVPLTSCLWGGMFSKSAASFILPNVSVNVTCQFYSLTMLPAEGYRQGQ
jgi:hypothetical protein